MRLMLVGSLLATLTACGAPPLPFNTGAAQADILKTLQSREAQGYGGTKPCTDFFEVSDLAIGDKRTEGDSTEVEVSFNVRSKYDIESRAFAATGCYGAPSDGWNVNEVATSKEKFRFERWDTGWRLAR